MKWQTKKKTEYGNNNYAEKIIYEKKINRKHQKWLCAIYVWCYGWEYEISLFLCVNSFKHTSNQLFCISWMRFFAHSPNFFSLWFKYARQFELLVLKIKSNVVPLKLYPVPLWVVSLLLINDHSNSMNPRTKQTNAVCVLFLLDNAFPRRRGRDKKRHEWINVISKRLQIS